MRARRNCGENRGRRRTRWKRITPTVPRDPGLGRDFQKGLGAREAGQWVLQGWSGPRAAGKLGGAELAGAGAGRKKGRWEMALTGGAGALVGERDSGVARAGGKRG